MALSGFRRRFRGAASAGVGTALLIATIVAANLLAYRDGRSLDLTEFRRLTLSAETKRVVDAVGERLDVDVFVRRDGGAGRDAAALLQRYEDQNRHVRVDVIDPDAEPGKAQRLNVTRYGTAVLRYQGRRVDVSTISEIELTSAILRLVRGRTPVACFVTGHGEARIDDEGPQGLSRFATLARRNGFEVREVTLGDAGAGAGCEVLVLAGPRVPLAATEIDAVRARLDGGGKVLILMDALTEADINPITRDWGIDFLGGVVVDVESNLNSDPTSAVIVDFPSANPVVDEVPSVLAPAASGLLVEDPDPRDGLHVSVLARSSQRSFLSPDPESTDQSQSLPGPVVVAAAADFSAVEGDPPRITRTRLLVIGGVVLAHNAIIEALGNAKLLANGLSWLAQSEVLLTVGAKPRGAHPLNVTDARQRLAFGLSVVAMPAATALLGAAVLVWRRRRH